MLAVDHTEAPQGRNASVLRAFARGAGPLSFRAGGATASSIRPGGGFCPGERQMAVSGPEPRNPGHGFVAAITRMGGCRRLRACNNAALTLFPNPLLRCARRLRRCRRGHEL